MKGAQKNHFTVGIIDDISNSSIEVGAEPDLADASTVSCKFWGLGSDSTVGANKNSIKIIGDHTDKYAQAYFEYDTKEIRRYHTFSPAFRRQAHPLQLSGNKERKLRCLS